MNWGVFWCFINQLIEAEWRIYASAVQLQAIIWTNAGILLNRTLLRNFYEILSKIHTFSLKKIYLKMSSA